MDDDASFVLSLSLSLSLSLLLNPNPNIVKHILLWLCVFGSRVQFDAFRARNRIVGG